MQATNGNFYGTTKEGGASSACSIGCGTVFEITPRGRLSTLYSFEYAGGYIPVGLVQATNGNFYGITYTGDGIAYAGGAGSECSGDCGTVFEITSGGQLTTLHSFDGADGSGPAGLVQATDGNFYGTTQNGGPAALAALAVARCSISAPGAS